MRIDYMADVANFPTPQLGQSVMVNSNQMIGTVVATRIEGDGIVVTIEINEWWEPS